VCEGCTKPVGRVRDVRSLVFFISACSSAGCHSSRSMLIFALTCSNSLRHLLAHSHTCAHLLELTSALARPLSYSRSLARTHFGTCSPTLILALTCSNSLRHLLAHSHTRAHLLELTSALARPLSYLRSLARTQEGVLNVGHSSLLYPLKVSSPMVQASVPTGHYTRRLEHDSSRRGLR
jgi:hypothetical protein